MALRVLLLLCLLSLTLQVEQIDCQIQGCQSCASANFCGICNENYILSKSGSCESTQAIITEATKTQRMLQTCSLQGCQTCSTTSNGCSVCMPAFYLNSTGGSCVRCVQPCETCRNATLCTACIGGYTMNTTTNTCVQSVVCTITGCTLCDPSGTKCMECSGGGVYDPTTNQCASCANLIVGCSACSSSTFCLQCNIGYMIDSAGRCTNDTTTNPLPPPPAPTNCSLVGCSVCQSATVCLQCNVGYVFEQVGRCMLDPTTNPLPPSPTNCSVPNCINCTSTGFCLACVVDNNKYVPSPTGQECIICDKSLPNMAGCISCRSRSSCGMCAPGFQLSFANNMGICVNCIIPNCVSCNMSGPVSVCAVCAPGYSPVLMGEACSQCSFPCATCNSNRAPKNCQTCALPFFFEFPSADGVCIKNYIRGCLKPNPNNSTLCGTCASGFTLTPDGLYCNFTCPQNCLDCASTNCTLCSPTFYLTSFMNCSKCLIGGCETCSNNGANCTTCMKGFYLVGGTDCAPCPPFCLDCTSNTSCSSLSEQSQVLITIGGEPVLASCDVTCLKCADTDKSMCLVCLEGFFLAQGKCIKCSGNCLTCDAANTSKCLSCYTNNFLSSANLCVACNQTCRTCSNADNPSSCTSCWDGFSLNGTVCVKGCPKNCFQCSNLTSCTKCNSGYTTFISNTSVLCAPCVTNCRSCAEGRPSVCLSCGSGFYLNGRTCRSCSPKCSSCSANGCRTCVQGFYLTKDLKCAPRCRFPCATCSTTDAKSCLSCMAGYSLNGTLCAPVSNCTSCNICPDGFVLKDGRCTACSTEKCQSCNSANLSQCFACQRGLYLSSTGTCDVCPAQCQGCLSGTGCLSCSTGYTIKQNAVQTSAGFECVKCNSPCETCVNNPDYCLTCSAGFTLSGWKCTQNFKFSFNTTLSVPMSVFEEKYMPFIMALAKAAMIIDINGITLNNITAGSVILEGSVAPEAASGTSEAGNQLQGFQAALQGAEIEGMPVGSSSIIVEDGVAGDESSNSKNMLPIILGICIPIGVLVIVGVVVFFIYGKKTPTNVSRFDTEHDAKGDNFNKTNEQIAPQPQIFGMQ